MKKTKFLIPAVILIPLLLFAFTGRLAEIPQIEIAIKGIDHDFLKEGVKPVEFGELSVRSKDESIVIEAFQITLARGNRAVDISDVNGNIFNLRKYSSLARSGDRIVVEVKKATGQSDSLSSSKSIVVLKVI